MCAKILSINLLKPIDYVMHQQINIQQLYALTALYLYVLYLSEKKQQLVPLTVSHTGLKSYFFVLIYLCILVFV